jgi:hypothetical protein
MIAVGSAAPAWAQDTRPYESVTESPRLYDHEKKEHVRGTVMRFRTMKPTENAAAFLQIEVKTDRGLLHVHLGPKWYMDEHISDLTLKKGDDVEIVGSKGNLNGEDVFIAAEVNQPRTGEHLRLRDQSGTPMWAGSELKS